jgi:hypothetical protein
MQLAYNVDPALGVVGTLAETSPTDQIEKRVANGVVRPGQYVVFNGAAQCNHPSAEPTAATRGGIALRNPYKQNDGVYADGDVVDIVTHGKVWVKSEAATTVNTNAFVRCVAAGAEELGALRTDADGTDAFHVEGLYFRSAGTALVKLEVRQSSVA